MRVKRWAGVVIIVQRGDVCTDVARSALHRGMLADRRCSLSQHGRAGDEKGSGVGERGG